MTEKVYYSDQDVKHWVHKIIQQMIKDKFHPDYIVGLTRGGLIPAVMLSQYLGIRMYTLGVSLRDAEDGPESNLWMAQDALGYPNPRKNILIIDDINDTGKTLNWIKEDWKASCFPDHLGWKEIWNKNVKFAVLIHNTPSSFKHVDYKALVINKEVKPEWCVFPWEQWW